MSKQFTNEYIDHLKGICAGVPKGKWKLWTSNSWRRFKDEGGMPVIEPTVQSSDGHPDLFLAAGVASFIEEASTALPECLAEIERLRQALERLTKELRSFQSLGYFTNGHWQKVIADAEETLLRSSVPAQIEPDVPDLERIKSLAYQISTGSCGAGQPYDSADSSRVMRGIANEILEELGATAPKEPNQ